MFSKHCLALMTHSEINFQYFFIYIRACARLLNLNICFPIGSIIDSGFKNLILFWIKKSVCPTIGHKKARNRVSQVWDFDRRGEHRWWANIQKCSSKEEEEHKYHFLYIEYIYVSTQCIHCIWLEESETSCTQVRMDCSSSDDGRATVKNDAFNNQSRS